jgi:hypothetical protein
MDVPVHVGMADDIETYLSHQRRIFVVIYAEILLQAFFLARQVNHHFLYYFTIFLIKGYLMAMNKTHFRALFLSGKTPALREQKSIFFY